MEKKRHNFDTNEAAYHIVHAIIESNLTESNEFASFGRLSRDLLQHGKHMYAANGIWIDIQQKNVYVKVKVKIKLSLNLLERLDHFQRQIKEEIQHLTGLSVARIDVAVINLFDRSID